MEQVRFFIRQELNVIHKAKQPTADGQVQVVGLVRHDPRARPIGNIFGNDIDRVTGVPSEGDRWHVLRGSGGLSADAVGTGWAVAKGTFKTIRIQTRRLRATCFGLSHAARTLVLRA